MLLYQNKYNLSINKNQVVSVLQNSNFLKLLKFLFPITEKSDYNK